MKGPPRIFLVLVILLLAVIAFNELVPERSETVELVSLDHQEEKRELHQDKPGGPFPPGTTQAQKGRGTYTRVAAHWRATVLVDDKKRSFVVPEGELENYEAALAGDRQIDLRFKLKRFGQIKLLTD